MRPLVCVCLCGCLRHLRQLLAASFLGAPAELLSLALRLSRNDNRGIVFEKIRVKEKTPRFG